MQFPNRRQAGKDLAVALAEYSDREDVLLFALPRGGVPVAAAVANALNLPMDVMLVRKLGVPGHEELAMGAISIGGLHVLNEHIINQLRLSKTDIDQVLAVEQAELDRRNQLYREDRTLPDMKDKTVIVIDDGLATGATMQAAILALGKAHPREIIIAVPVGASETCDQLEKQVGKVVCLLKPTPFMSVGRWYQDFDQTTDDEVKELLNKVRQRTENAANTSSFATVGKLS